MQKIILILSLVLLSCSSNNTSIVGTWKVLSKFYSAKYEIIEEDNFFSAKVLYYNDNTTVIRQKDGETKYAFKNLKFSNEVYVDAVSGATKTDNTKPNIKLNLKHLDTLEVTTYIRNKPLKELWVRIKE